MEKQEFSLGEYLADGIEIIVKRAVRAKLTDPRESAFMARFALSSREAARKRAEAEGIGENIPPFLIASITKDTSLREALRSPLFISLRDQSILTGDHSGGCVLFEKRAEVEAILSAGVLSVKL